MWLYSLYNLFFVHLLARWWTRLGAIQLVFSEQLLHFAEALACMLLRREEETKFSLKRKFNIISLKDTV